VLTLIAKPAEDAHRSESLDMTGAVLSIAGMGLSVLGLQQAQVWGWSSIGTWACIVVGLILIGVFVLWELRVEQPLVPMRLFANRGFAVDNAVLFLLSICFVPLFFFASLYAQIALGETASNAGLMLLVFFGGFTIAAQWGGRILDARGARPTVVVGCAVAAVGFYLWANKLTDLSFSSQWPYLAIAGAGMGLVLGPVSTDALNRSASTAYGAVTGVTQTVRNYGGSLGLAVLGSILVTRIVSKVEHTLTSHGVPSATASRIAHAVSGASAGGGGSSSGFAHAPHGIVHRVQYDFGSATKTVVIGMAAAMAAAFVVALVAMPSGRAGEEVVSDAETTDTAPSSQTAATSS